MKNAVIGNRNEKEKFVQSQIIPKYAYIVNIHNLASVTLTLTLIHPTSMWTHWATMWFLLQRKFFLFEPAATLQHTKQVQFDRIVFLVFGRCQICELYNFVFLCLSRLFMPFELTCVACYYLNLKFIKGVKCIVFFVPTVHVWDYLKVVGIDRE